jgi:hypothetical protein
VQADGKILMGGPFTTLGGQPHSLIGRLNNTAPAIQSLTFDGSNITWLRAPSPLHGWRTRRQAPPDTIGTFADRSVHFRFPIRLAFDSSIFNRSRKFCPRNTRNTRMKKNASTWDGDTVGFRSSGIGSCSFSRCSRVWRAILLSSCRHGSAVFVADQQQSASP